MPSYASKQYDAFNSQHRSVAGLEKSPASLKAVAVNSALQQLRARPVLGFQEKMPSQLVKKGQVAQLARWRLVAQDQWTGIDPENYGQSNTTASGTHPVGTIWEDTDNSTTQPTPFGGSALASGSYGDWRKVVRPEEQVDHFPPNASYKGTPFENIPYAHRPAFPIRNREGHRPAQGEEYGFGGHVSTTNSTFVQKGYTPDLNSMMKKGDFFGALKKELSDKANVALYQYGNRAAFNELLKPGLQLSYERQLITEKEYFHLLSMLEEFKLYPKG